MSNLDDILHENGYRNLIYKELEQMYDIKILI